MIVMVGYVVPYCCDVVLHIVDHVDVDLVVVVVVVVVVLILLLLHCS